MDNIVRVERALADEDREIGAERVARAGEIATRFLDNIETVVYGKRDEIKLVLTALICGGHVLLEDVPGTAKTMLARAIAGSIEGATTSRIQCTPDLQPTDVTGLAIFDQRSRDYGEIKEAVDTLRARRVEDKIRMTQNSLSDTPQAYQNLNERLITSDIGQFNREMDEALRAAQSAQNSNDERRTADAMDRARSLVRGMESIDERLRQQQQGGSVVQGRVGDDLVYEVVEQAPNDRPR